MAPRRGSDRGDVGNAGAGRAKTAAGAGGAKTAAGAGGAKTAAGAGGAKTAAGAGRAKTAAGAGRQNKAAAGEARQKKAGDRVSALAGVDLQALLERLDAADRPRPRRVARGAGGADARDLEVLRTLVARAIEERVVEEGAAGKATATGGPARRRGRTAGDVGPDGWDAAEEWDEREAWDEEGTGGEDDWESWHEEDEEDDEWEDGELPGALGGSRDRWARFAPAKPIPVDGGLVARTRRGAIGATWWSRRFLGAIESVLVGGRLQRGRSYARKGQVVELQVGPGLIEAKVQGTRAAPYRVRLAMPVVADEWSAIIGALAAEAGYAARMLAGELPPEVEEVFAAQGASLFPGPGTRLTTDCTCPDWANPCKHVAAVCYLVAEGFDRDPFGLLAWRGRGREAVLSALRRLRAGQPDGQAHGDPRPEAASAVPPQAPPLAECLLGFWKAGPELAEVRLRPEAAALADAVLRNVPRGLVELRGRDLTEWLGPAYAELTAAAARRALGDTA